MKSAMRAYDVVGRYGGEEFLVVLPGSDGAGARAQAERVRESFTVSPVTSRGHSLNVTCSFGVSWRAHATPADADALIREADLALYSAKANGRNRVEIFEPELVAA
jgi:diguanylate cyclase (GGDEF)-like protein